MQRDIIEFLCHTNFIVNVNLNLFSQEMKEKAHGEYTYALMHQDAAANVIFVNGNILHQSAKEIGPQNAQVTF